MTASESGLSQETHDKARAWYRAELRVKRLCEQLKEAEGELACAKNDLGNHLAPRDVKEGESFNIWYGSGLLHIRCEQPQYSFEVSWRQEPSVKQLGDMS